MNPGFREFLAAEASDRFQSYPASIDRPLLAGMRLYRWRVALTTTAAVAVVIALVSAVALTPGGLGVGPCHTGRGRRWGGDGYRPGGGLAGTGTVFCPQIE
ncbi:hypothetical protein [Arthrobacter sp. CAN_A1]|uniref:hypothetical protein n=1 Tax=Arthrobacter sp. CAN_A1 TaxID=2787717 RepID=UPI0018CAAD8F